MIRRASHDRIVLSAFAGLCVNLAYALYHAALGITSRSLWLLLLCAYYMILSAMRFSAVLYYGKSRSGRQTFSEHFLLRFLGVMLVLLAVLLVFSVYLSFRYDVAVRRREIMMITIATYTFYKLTMAAVNAVRVRKCGTPFLLAIRNIGCADAAASLLTLQRSMLVSFEGMSACDAAVLNALTGAGVCVLVVLLGIFMMIGGKKNGKIKDREGK